MHDVIYERPRTDFNSHHICDNNLFAQEINVCPVHPVEMFPKKYRKFHAENLKRIVLKYCCWLQHFNSEIEQRMLYSLITLSHTLLSSMVNKNLCLRVARYGYSKVVQNQFFLRSCLALILLQSFKPTARPAAATWKANNPLQTLDSFLNLVSSQPTLYFAPKKLFSFAIACQIFYLICNYRVMHTTIAGTPSKNFLFSLVRIHSRCQFHQHFICAFAPINYNINYILKYFNCSFFVRKFIGANAHIKCWWNWTQVGYKTE